MSYYKIKEWAKYQHYKDRCPPWIKLHKSLLTSKTWVMLDDASRVLAVACMMLAADTDNKIPADPAYMKRVAYLNVDPDFNPLVETEFLEFVDEDSGRKQSASKTLATCNTERGERESRAASALQFSPIEHLKGLGVGEKVAADWLKLRKKKRAEVTETAIEGIQREAGKAGISLQAALEKCCERGWQGFDAAWLAEAKQPPRTADPFKGAV